MNKFGTQTPYIASYVIAKKDGEVGFILGSNTSWMNGFYSLPSGKVESEESFTQAAVREAQEEIGINVAISELEHIHTVHRKEDSLWVDLYFDVKKFEGVPYNAEPHMHSEFTWLDPDDLPENVIPAVKDALQKIKKGYKYSEFGWN